MQETLPILILDIAVQSIS